MPSEISAFADALPLPLAEPSPPLEAPHFPWIDTILEQVELEVAKSSGGRDEPRLPDLPDKLSLPAPKANTLTPNDVTLQPTEEEIQQMLARERALLASMMGLDSGSVSINVERPFIAEAPHETSAAPAITSDIRTGVEEPWGGKWRMLLATAAVLVFAALGAIQWRSLRNHTSNGPVKAMERNGPDQTRSNPEDKGHGQSGMPTDSETHTSSPMTQTEEQSKPQDQSVAPRPLSKVSPAKPTSELDDGVLRLPAAIPRSIAVVKKEEAPPNGTTEMPGSLPGGLPNGVPNSVTNIIRDIPVAVPKVTAEKVRVSSGVVQGLLIHQVTPEYPPQARQAGIQGKVVLQVVIGKDGTVQNLHVLSGHPMLIQAAMDAVRKWRYKPYYLNGEPVEADSQIIVNFTL
jgi:protein TonB